MRILALILLGLVIAVIAWIAWEIRSDRKDLSQYREPTIRRNRNRNRMPPMD